MFHVKRSEKRWDLHHIPLFSRVFYVFISAIAAFLKRVTGFWNIHGYFKLGIDYDDFDGFKRRFWADFMYFSRFCRHLTPF